MSTTGGAALQPGNASTTTRFEVNAIPSVIGVEIARHAAVIEDVLQAFKRTRSITRGQMGALKAANHALQRLSVQSQQLTRLASGRLRQSHERVAIDALIRRVLNENDSAYRDAGLKVEQHLQPVEVIIDPGLLMSLIETALGCAARHGQAVGIWLHIKNWPEHGVLTVHARPHVATAVGAPDESDESLEWVMLLQIAETMGVLVAREIHADKLVLTVEFPRTVRQLEGLSAVEVDTGNESVFGESESKPLAGHRVLLVTRDEKLHWDVRTICENMRLVLELTPSVAQAVRFCELDKPDLIIIDERLHDALFDELRSDLLRYDVNFPCVEIATKPNLVEMASWDGERMSRISRDALETQLASLLVMELAKVF